MKSGNLGEIAAMKHFAKRGYNIYSPLTENSTYDFLIEKEGIVLRVEVKTTSSKNIDGKYRVELKSTRSNRTKNRVLPFDNTKMDILAVYILPLDEVKVYNPLDIKTRSQMLVEI